jgi:hypothetical protein
MIPPHKSELKRPGMAVYAYNPSYVGVINRRTVAHSQPQAKSKTLPEK